MIQTEFAHNPLGWLLIKANPCFMALNFYDFGIY